MKYAARLFALSVHRYEGALSVACAGSVVEPAVDRSCVAAVSASAGPHRACVACVPPLPEPAAVADGETSL